MVCFTSIKRSSLRRTSVKIVWPLRIVDDIYFPGEQSDRIAGGKKQFSVQMMGHFPVKFQIQRRGFEIMHLRVLQMTAGRHHGKYFKPLQKFQLLDQTYIQQSVVGYSLGRQIVAAGKTAPD